MYFEAWRVCRSVRKPEAFSGASGSDEFEGEEGGALQAANVRAVAISDSVDRRKWLERKAGSMRGTLCPWERSGDCIERWKVTQTMSYVKNAFVLHQWGDFL
jgi:hypothetical protein